MVVHSSSKSKLKQFSNIILSNSPPLHRRPSECLHFPSSLLFKMVYKWCVVPLCTNTSIKSPNKLFVSVPTNPKRRKMWLHLARRDSNILMHTNVFMCEDHFDLPNDMENYIRYRVMGSVSQVRMKPGCIPTRFECQTERRKLIPDTIIRPCTTKKRRKILVDESEKDLEERSAATKYLESGETSSVKSETTGDDERERRWVPRYRHEAPKASDRTLIGDKETSDVDENNESRTPSGQYESIEIQIIDKEDSWWAEDQNMYGIETEPVDEDVTTPAPPNYSCHKPPEFSWHRPPEVIPCADDVEIQTDASLTAPDSASGDGGDDRRRIESYTDRLHFGHKCIECGSEIVGYRYTCVQCCDVDLCSACEASGAHPEHYVLRLPRPEPAGAVKGVLETLRGLLDHLPLHTLHEVKKEETDDGDPLSCGYVPPEPFSETTGYEFEDYEEDKEPIKEARLPADDESSQSDLELMNVDLTSDTPTDTADIHQPANEHSPDKVRLDVGKRQGSRKVLLRLKKLSELNDDSAVKCSVIRPCEADIETMSGARAASGVSASKLRTGVTESGASVTRLRASAIKLRTAVTTSGVSVTTSKAGVTAAEAGVTAAGAVVTAAGAGVTATGAGVTAAGAGVTAAGAKIPVVKIARMDDRLLHRDGRWTLIP